MNNRNFRKALDLTRTLSGHRDTIYALAVHPATHRLASGSYDGEVRIWNTDSGELITRLVAAPGLANAGR